MSITNAHLRIARATDHMDDILRFYRDGLGFELIGSFEDHDGFDGIMLGHSGAAYHLEFTHKHGQAAGRAPGQENLLVFYLPDTQDGQRSVERMAAAGFQPVASFNPYWDCLLYTSPSPRDRTRSRMPSSA